MHSSVAVKKGVHYKQEEPEALSPNVQTFPGEEEDDYVRAVLDAAVASQNEAEQRRLIV
jgi:hypothetical protein